MRPDFQPWTPERMQPRSPWSPGGTELQVPLTSLWLVGALLSLMGLGIAIRLLWFQIGPNWELARRDLDRTVARQWRYYTVPRGVIVDRNGTLLAGNRFVYQLDVVPAGIRDPKKVAESLAEVLGMDERYLLRVLTLDAQVVMVAPRLTKEQREKLFKVLNTWYKQDEEEAPIDVKNWDIFRLTPKLERVYPYGDLASNVLGFVSQRDDVEVVGGYMIPEVGNFGLEGYYQSWLYQPPVREVVAYDPFSAPPESVRLPEDAPALVLTLDAAIQAMAEDILEQALETYRARRGVILVLRPKTGEILAMAMAPRPNLSDYDDVLRFLREFEGEGWNWAVSHAYEPGSVLKPLILSIALETDTIEPDFVYEDTGLEQPCGGIAPVRNWDWSAHGTQDLVGCLALSLNTCFANIARRIPRSTLLHYLEAYGFGNLTGVDVDAEVNGLISVNTCVDHSRVGFGHAISVTPLQLAAAMAALANGGRYMRPYLVAYRFEDGEWVPVGRPEIMRQVISEETARLVNRFLAQALKADSYKNAVVPGYTLAGKTGTALNPGDPEDLLDATMVGWGPVGDPQFLVLVWLEDPKEQDGWASLTAAPVFREVVQRLVVMLGVPPDRPVGEQAAQAVGAGP